MQSPLRSSLVIADDIKIVFSLKYASDDVSITLAARCLLLKPDSIPLSPVSSLVSRDGPRYSDNTWHSPLNARLPQARNQ